MILGVTMIGCQADNGTQEKPYYDEWIDYTAKDLQNIFRKHEEAFDYIARVLTELDAKVSYRILIESKKNKNLLFFSYDNGEAKYTDGSDLGYVKDELFEKYVYEILVQKKFSRIYSSSESSLLIFGRGYPIWYNPEHDHAYGKNTDTTGNLKKHWFYYSQNPWNVQMKPGKPYYNEWIDYMAEELQSIFWEHEKAFDYIAQIILSLDKTDFYIVVGDPQKGNLLFYLEDPTRLFNSDDPSAIMKYTDGSDVGYVKDEIFEQYVNDILVGEKFSRIAYHYPSPIIDFGHACPIYYHGRQPAVEENTWNSGSLKEHWFYYIQSYV